MNIYDFKERGDFFLSASSLSFLPARVPTCVKMEKIASRKTEEVL